MARIPQTLIDAINEEPERFLSYLNIQKIKKSKNPHKEFLNQFQKAFGYKQGLNLFQYVENKYNLLNNLYKNKEIQDKIKENFKGSLKRKETRKFFSDFEEKIKREQKRKEIKIKKKINVSQYKMKNKIIKFHKRTTPLDYSDRQKRFILKRKEYPLRKLTYEFNKAFNLSTTSTAIKNKKLRLMGKKK